MELRKYLSGQPDQLTGQHLLVSDHLEEDVHRGTRTVKSTDLIVRQMFDRGCVCR